MTFAAALIFCALLAILAVFQAALVAGAPIGHFAWGGQHRVLPRGLRIGSAVAIAIYAVFSVIVLQRAGLVALVAQAVADIGIWIVFGYSTLGIAVNAISRSLPERLTMTSLCIVLAALALIVAMGW